jgi:hypothetical protein
MVREKADPRFLHCSKVEMISRMCRKRVRSELSTEIICDKAFILIILLVVTRWGSAQTTNSAKVGPDDRFFIASKVESLVERATGEASDSIVEVADELAESGRLREDMGRFFIPA